MPSKVPFVKQETNWFAIIPHLFVIGILTLFFYMITKNYYVEASFVTYFILTRVVRFVFIPKVVYSGIKLIKEAKFDQAIPFIQETIDYYTKNSWIDKFRFLLLISSSKKTFRETSICNLAYCYLQVGDIKKARSIYMNILEQYPMNNNAKSMLNTINLVENDVTNNIGNETNDKTPTA